MKRGGGCNNGTKPSPHGARIDRHKTGRTKKIRPEIYDLNLNRFDLLWDASEGMTRMELPYLEDARERGQHFPSPFNGQYMLYRVIISEKYHIRALMWLV